MTWAQYVEWFQYNQVAPFGELRRDLRMGIATAAQWNTQMVDKKDLRTPQSFMPKFGGSTKSDDADKSQPLTSQKAWQGVKNIAKAYGVPLTPQQVEAKKQRNCQAAGSRGAQRRSLEMGG